MTLKSEVSRFSWPPTGDRDIVASNPVSLCRALAAQISTDIVYRRDVAHRLSALGCAVCPAIG